MSKNTTRVLRKPAAQLTTTPVIPTPDQIRAFLNYQGDHPNVEAAFIARPQRAADAPPKPSAFHKITEATELARQLANRLCALADRIAGCVPEGCTASDPNSNGTKPSGLVAALEDDAFVTRHCLDAAFAAIERIERELP